MASKGGLGRGLNSLIPSSPEEILVTNESTLRDVPIDQISTNPNQPRRSFDEESLETLAASIREMGILQPLLVREVEGGYELIAGERRLRAAKRTGLRTAPVVVRSASEIASLEEALVENLHRQDLNPLEEAAAYQLLIEEFGHTQDQVAQRVGKSRSAVANLLRLFQLTPAVQKLVADGLLTAGHAKALLAHPDRSYQESLAMKSVREALSVRRVEELVKERLILEDQLADGADGSTGNSDEEDESPERGSGDLPDPSLRPPGLLELEELLAEYLETRVSITMSARRGKVTVEFADLEDLERIYRHIIEKRG